MDEPPALAHTCSILLDSGHVCGQQFKCLRDLRLHQFRITTSWAILTKLRMSTNVRGAFLPRLCPRENTLDIGCSLEHALQALVAAASSLPSRMSLVIWNADSVNMSVLSCCSCLRTFGRISDSFTVGVSGPRRGSMGGMDTWTAQRRQAHDNGNQPPTKMRALSTGEDAETVRKALLLVCNMTLR